MGKKNRHLDGGANQHVFMADRRLDGRTDVEHDQLARSAYAQSRSDYEARSVCHSIVIWAARMTPAADGSQEADS